MPAVAILVLVIAGLVLVSLWRWIDGLALTDPGQKDKATAHLDAVKIAASIVVAGGGVFALYLTARRQRTQEEELQVRREELAQRDRAQAHTERAAELNRLHAERMAANAEQEATERQITELFTKAVEQLGHEQAAVRLGGLYTLERLAQNHVEQRRPVVSVLCSYLRMPYLDPNELDPNDEELAAGAELITAGQRRERLQEREVRYTIQRILRDHAHNAPEPGTPPDATYWGSTNPATDINVNLTGATLVKISLTGRRLHPSTGFAFATFIGNAWFDQVTFTSDAAFSVATFTGIAGFSGATFTGGAWFHEATFTGDTRFDRTTFTGGAKYHEEEPFTGAARFDDATFTDGVRLNSARTRQREGVWPPGWRVRAVGDAADEGDRDAWFLVEAAKDVGDEPTLQEAVPLDNSKQPG